MKKLILKKAAYCLVICSLVFTTSALTGNYKQICLLSYIAIFVLASISIVRFLKTERKLSLLYKRQESSIWLLNQKELGRIEIKIENPTIDGVILLIIGIFFEGLLTYNFFPSLADNSNLNQLFGVGFIIVGIVLFFCLFALSFWSSVFNHLSFEIKTYGLTSKEVEKLVKSDFLERAKKEKFKFEYVSFFYIEKADNQSENNIDVPSPRVIANFFREHRKLLEINFSNFLEKKNVENENKIKDEKKLEKIASYLTD
ncbi:MAG: hypothetical protein WAV23_03605 [Minisyncoccia bacterium]